MSEPVSLSNYKNRKKNAKIISELTQIIYLYELMIAGLNLFNKYVIVRETVHFLQEKKLLLEIAMKKVKDVVGS